VIWLFVRLAYMWAVHMFVLVTLYRHERVMWVRMNVVSALLTLLFFWPVLALPGRWAVAVEVLGMMLVVAPYPLALWARRSLGQRNWEAPRSTELPEAITTRGPYGIIRHPLYLVMFLGGAGEFCITGTWLCIPLTLLFDALAYANARHDERKILGSPLAEAYREYSEQVRKRFVPGLL
jgi:protein-S-isoprenylcysteine O-methyltransferase Ste14